MKRRLAALGSWFGDDRIGWVLLEQLSRGWQQPSDLEYVSCERTGMEWLYGEVPRQLILLDAVSSGASPGHVHRLEYPHCQIAGEFGGRCSVHGLTLPQGLELARNIGRLPEQVLIWGVEIDTGSRSEHLSPMLADRVAELAAGLARDLMLSPAS